MGPLIDPRAFAAVQDFVLGGGLAFRPNRIVFVSAAEPHPFRDDGATEDDGDVTAHPRVWPAR